MILVIGGGSKIGSALLSILLSQGESVRALVRGDSESDRLPAGAGAVRGDLADVDSLVAAMTGASKVFLLSSPHPDATAWHCNAVDAARKAGVRLVVRSSILGADRDTPAEFVSSHTTADRYLMASGLEYVIVRPNLFQQNVPESTIPSIDPGGQFYLNAGPARLSMVDTRDVAAAAAITLTEPGHAGQIYEITGPEALSYHDVAAKLAQTLSRQVRYIEVTDDATRDALLGLGMNEWFVGALVGLFQDYRGSGLDGYAAKVTDTIQRLTGQPPRSLDMLLSEL
jgi:uncharacterized protein YbjT (DUF2867 family)